MSSGERRSQDGLATTAVGLRIAAMPIIAFPRARAVALAALMLAAGAARPASAQRALVIQTDFGLAEGAIAEMKGVAMSVDPGLRIFDLTHLIPPYDIWEAAIRLQQTAGYWPAGTVFVSIVDPGVGTPRKAVVVRSRSGHYFVGPDNGTFTFVAKSLGIEAVREIDEAVNRLPGSNRSYTFHGRDIFAYTAARLAAGIIDFDGVGPDRGTEVVSLPVVEPGQSGRTLAGTVLTLDQPFGNVWSNIGAAWVDRAGIKAGDRLEVVIREGNVVRFRGTAPYVKSFGDVPRGAPLVYLNSLLNLAVALNQGNFALRYHVGRGPGWRIEVSAPAKGR